MKKVNTINGQELREMFLAATGWLEKSSAEVDALNVFPVPDGDTGTNMLLTMRSTMEEAHRAPDRSATLDLPDLLLHTFAVFLQRDGRKPQTVSTV